MYARFKLWAIEIHKKKKKKKDRTLTQFLFHPVERKKETSHASFLSLSLGSKKYTLTRSLDLLLLVQLLF